MYKVSVELDINVLKFVISKIPVLNFENWYVSVYSGQKTDLCLLLMFIFLSMIKERGF